MIDTTSFKLAAENMAYDLRCLEQLQLANEKSFFRFYRWKDKGLTYPKRISLPESLGSLDAGIRATGGGIVFHSPGDMVISIGGKYNVDLFPKEWRGIMDVVKFKFLNSFTRLGLTVIESNRKEVENHMFCLSYGNPYELYFEDQKVLAIAMRRFKDYFLIQGIVYLPVTF